MKAIITLYLLQLQLEDDDGTVAIMQGDQQTAQECYLISIRLLVERPAERGPAEPLPPYNKPRAEPLPLTAEALVIHLMT